MTEGQIVNEDAPFYVVAAPKQSDSITKLIGALVAARLEVQHPKKNKKNAHFKNEYADLGAVIDAVIPTFAKHGIAVLQLVDGDQLVTRLMHTSGEWIVSSADVKPDRTGPQAFGSALTYQRRYTLGTLGGVHSEEDDDAEAAEVRPAAKPKPATKAKRGAKKGKAAAPAEDAPEPAPAGAEPSKFFEAAKKLIETTDDVPAAVAKVQKSTKLTDEEKESLTEIAKGKE